MREIFLSFLILLLTIIIYYVIFILKGGDKMKKDLDKLFSRSIETYYFLLLIVVIIKLLGGNYFEIVYTNKTINIINDFITYWRLENIWYGITLYINVYITLAVTCSIKDDNIKRFSIIPFIVGFIIQILKANINIPILFIVIDFLYLLGFSLLYLKIKEIKITKIYFRNFFIYSLFVNIAQIMSIVIRGIGIQNQNNFTDSFIVGMILNLDYLLVLIIFYKYYFMKGVSNLWDLVVSSGSQKLTSLKGSLKNLLRNFRNKKPMSKEEKITNAIYLPLYLLWNLFTMLIIVLIAFLNDAFIEAIFITIAFWFNKFSFGKPFHFKSVGVCFAFSSFTYYVLTRITFKTETSFFIPIFLGVALSYITSHFIKKNTKLYKGMAKEELHQIVMNVDDNPITIKILEQYYCDRLNDVQIAINVSYSIDSVRKKRQNVNKKLRNLH